MELSACSDTSMCIEHDLVWFPSVVLKYADFQQQRTVEKKLIDPYTTAVGIIFTIFYDQKTQNVPS